MSVREFWNGKRIVVTGGTAGLGQALAMEARELGARVAVVARGAQGLSRMAELGFPTIDANVADKHAVYRIAAEATQALGGVDVLINNASYLGQTPLRLLADTDCEDLEAVVATNLVGPFRLVKAFLPGMMLQGAGWVVNVSSDAATSPYPTWGSYGTSKAALDHLTRIFDAELGAHGVNFLALDPGDMRTEMHFAAVPDANPADLADPREVARAMLEFLAKNDRRIGDVRLAANQWRAL